LGGRLEPAAWQWGLRSPDQPDWRGEHVPSSFDFRRQAVLYCPVHLPDPRHEGFLDAAIGELADLIEAAGGRTLALFTSYRALHAAADALRDRWEWPVLVQDEADRHALLETFRADEHSCLFATMAFWQGVDVPGDAVRLVVIDTLPFARPDEPLTQARREAAEAAGRSGFETVDLARAARLLAQGAGRLIRSASDRGVVAVLDRRLATARYRAAILDSLPPLRRSVDGDDVRAFLRSLDPVDAPAVTK
jgi:ATP-dependent DNA helicase DinG